MSRICVVLPTYNRAHLVARAVRSVLSQTYQDWELRVIDDGSTDETRAIVEPFVNSDTRISYEWQENRGVSSARNNAIFRTASPWIACLDSDDEWLPHKLEKHVEFMSHHPSIRLIHSEENWIRDGQVLRRQKKHQKSGGRVFLNCLPLCFISPSTVVIQTELVKSLGGFREDYPVCEDYDLWLKITAQEDVGYIAEALINKHGGHADQLSFTTKAMDEYRARSLWEIRNHSGLTAFDRMGVLKEFIAKGEVLIKGFKKYGHLEKSIQWESLRVQALSQLAHLNSAHSAADLAPRSESTLILNGN